MPLLASNSWESLLVFVAVMAISGVSNWLKRRQAERERSFVPQPRSEPKPLRTNRPVSPANPPPTPVPLPRPVLQWEEELRRLLEGDTEPAPTLAPAPPPPPPVPAAPPPPPLQPPRMPAPQAREPHPTHLPVPTRSPVRFPEMPGALDDAPAPAFQLATMEQSASAYGRASHLDDKTGVRLRDIDAQTVRHSTPPAFVHDRAVRSREAERVIAQLRNPHTARQVVLASMILGPPRSLDMAGRGGLPS